MAAEFPPPASGSQPYPFSLGAGNTIALAVSSTSASITLPSATAIAAPSLRLRFVGSSDCYVRGTVGASTAIVPTATPGDTPIVPGVIEAFSKGAGVDTISAIGGTGTLYISWGTGL